MRCRLVLTFLVTHCLAYSGSPQLQFSTLLGGSAQTGAQAVAIDSSGNIVVAGNTAAADFPTTSGAFQRTYAGGQCGPEPQPCRAIFVSKFSPDGSRLISSTYLDGAGDDTVASMALDASDDIYLTGATNGNLPNLSPFPGDTLHNGIYTAKLSADGSKLLYATLLPLNPAENTVTGLAVDPAGAVYLTGSSTGGIPTVNALQSAVHTAQVFRTGDSGTHWQSFMDGLPPSTIYSMATVPSDPQALYLALSSGLYKTANGGSHWDAVPSLGVTPFSVVVDPSQPQTIYVSSLAPPCIMKSTDRGQSWSSIMTGRFVRMVAIDAKNPSALYAPADDGLYKSTDAGNSWSLTGLVAPPGEPFFVHNVVLDPSAPATVYAGTPEGVRKSLDGGLTWTTLADGFTRSTDVRALAIDLQHPQTLFASTTVVSGVYRTNDGGAHWSLSSWPSPLNYVRSLLVDPRRSSTVWAGTSGGLYVSHDGGSTWAWPSTTIPEQDVPALASSGGELYATESALQPDAFALKLDSTGTRIVYATYLGGTGSDLGSGIAVDAEGRAYVTGSTDSFDFPVSQALQAHSGGRKDAFLAVLDPSGSKLAWSTYFGGAGEDTAAGIALDSAGNIHVAGTTDSPDLPLLHATQSQRGGAEDAWTATWQYDGSALLFSTYFGGSGTDYAAALASDAHGDVYVAGSTNSPDLPVSGIQTSLQGVLNGFVAAWGATNNSAFATYLGGSNVDYPLALAANERGAVFVGGETLSPDFPLAYPFQSFFAPCSTHGCVYEAFLAGIAANRFHRPPPIVSPPAKRGRLP